MKTISELNSKWQYRLIKVIYTIALFFCILPVIEIWSSSGPQYDNEKSYIKCENGNVYRLKENNIYLRSDYMSSSEESEAKNLCFDGFTDFVKDKYGRNTIKSTETEHSNKYKLVSVYTERNWFQTIIFSVSYILFVLIFFEIIKRTFYYVFFGSFRPFKEAK